MNAGDTGEDELIRRLVCLAPQPESPGKRAGDDCALLEVGGSRLLLKTDALVEGIHYARGEDAQRVGWKAIARVVSDFAACGGRPGEFLITLAVPAATEVCWLEDLYRGMGRCMEHFGARLVGGETSSLPAGAPIVVSVFGVGRVDGGAVILRSGGSPGDDLWVTGTLGGSLAGKHLDFLPRVGEAQWLAAQGVVTAMMDLSDGLAKDLPRLASASACGFRLDPGLLPCSPGCGVDRALGDGEDYELLFAVPPDHRDRLASGWRDHFPDTRLTRIGSLVPDGDGEELAGGWDHFPGCRMDTPG